MPATLEFYYDLSSPPSYIAHERLAGVAARTGAEIVLRPVLVGGVFKLSGNAGPVDVPTKRAYMMETELPRAAKHYGLDLDFHAGAPFNSLGLMRGAIVADEDDRLADYTAAMFRAQWAEARDMTDFGSLAQALNAISIDAEALFARTQEQPIKDKLIAATEAAVTRGVFGVPTMFVADEMFFGQDHLDLAEGAL